MRTLRDLLIVEAQDLHSGETLLWDSLRRIAESARNQRLGALLAAQRLETQAQIGRLEAVLARLGGAPSDDDCEAMEGIIAQAEELMEDDLPGEIMDAALAVTAIKVKHFEIASYRALLALAEACGEIEPARLLRESLAEEWRAVAELDAIAAQDIHLRAAQLAPAG